LKLEVDLNYTYRLSSSWQWTHCVSV